MSVSSTRKVSGSPSFKRVERYYAGAEGNPSVDVIDTNNSVLVKDERQEFNGQNSSSKQDHSEHEDVSLAHMAASVSSNTIEALSETHASYPEDTHASQNQKVTIYDNNQAIVENNNASPADNPYLKHFYENNQILEDIDELI